MRNSEALVRIVEQCLETDRLAIRLYSRLAAAAPGTGLASLWSAMAAEEEEHLALKEELRALVEDQDVPPLFPSPSRTLRELRDLSVRAAQIMGQRVPEVAAAQFLAAFRLEFCVLHPALERLMHFHGLLRPGGPPHGTADYGGHLRRLLEGVRLHGAGHPELELLGEALLQMWNQLSDLAHEASYDVLTRVLSRRGLFTHMRLLAYLARRNDFTAGAMLVDIDHLTRINDIHGPHAGDEVLTRVAGIISATLRRSDLVGRYGGEEFLVFLPQLERGRLPLIAEKVRAAVESGTQHHLPATVSVGAACTEFAAGVEARLASLIREADGCLLAAKGAGRNRIVASPSL